uniref:Uncharacterized protein n=1 Tax=Anguilla anguilla TaxID=7936 RepID=A0A0E9R1J2_ANGAN
MIALAGVPILVGFVVDSCVDIPTVVAYPVAIFTHKRKEFLVHQPLLLWPNQGTVCVATVSKEAFFISIFSCKHFKSPYILQSFS